MTELRGKRVVLRPFRPEEFDTLWAVRHGDDRRCPAELTEEQLRQRVALSGTLTAWGLELAIDAGRRMVGEIQAYRQNLPSGVFGIGIVLFDAGDRGRGYGTDAVALMGSHLFETERIRRVGGGTTPDNAAMRRVFRRLGFVEEGVLRRFLPSADGGGADCVMYGMTKDDWENAKTGWT